MAQDPGGGGVFHPKISVDGGFGSYTKEVWQRDLRVRGFYTRQIDGSFGPESWKAVQRWLKSMGYYSRNIDGSVGDYTILGLFKAVAKYGYPMEPGSGVFWPNGDLTVRIQRYLNKYGNYLASVYPKWS
ncbi:peptidoglycan-binding domain-containing protein [Glutamicibacter nicotianae]|uniref:peptidoglycan-binding domain-containing protein n=1 Tax=Glutamicibacter nicotianae TaxID=37929 RepID=UPI0025559C1A|nr:hypothetical protein [Glutamicibacter nicotianae]WIV44546.1 hypothetical protein QQS42_02700 [Glutamicibacter nicotianae]